MVGRILVEELKSVRAGRPHLLKQVVMRFLSC
jgi:hypothetical protein